MSHELGLNGQERSEGLDFAPSAAYVLSAGLGTRMDTLTQGRIPKGLVEIEPGRVLLEFVFDIAEANRVKNIVACISHQSEKIVQYSATNGWGTNVSFSIEEAPKGVIKTFENGLKNFPPQKDFLLLHGDEIITNFSLPEMYRFHRNHGGLATGLLSRNPQAKRTVIMKLGSDGKVLDSLRESEEAKLDYHASLGLFIFKPEIAKEVERFGTWEAMIKTLAIEGKLFGFSSDAFFFNINGPQDISDFLEHKRRTNQT